MTEITSQELKQLQDKGEKILAQFTATWCGPCRALSPLLTKISDEYQNVTFIKIDVDNGDNSDLLMEFSIMSVPTVILFDGQKVVDISKGLQNESFYKNILSSL